MQKELLMSNNLFYSSQKWELAASQIFLWIVIQYFIFIINYNYYFYYVIQFIIFMTTQQHIFLLK